MSEEEQGAKAEDNEGKSGEASKEATPGETASEAVSGIEDTLKLSAQEMVKRRSRWQSSAAAIRYVYSVSADDQVRVRDSDRATSLMLLIMCFIALLSLLPFIPVLQEQRMPVLGVIDLLLGVMLLMYVANRLGILTTLTPRQALLTWQLMLGSSLLGIYMAINLAVVIAFAVANTPPIVIPPPAG